MLFKFSCMHLVFQWSDLFPVSQTVNLHKVDHNWFCNKYSGAHLYDHCKTPAEEVLKEGWSLLSDQFMTMEIWRERFTKGLKREVVFPVIHDHGNLKGKVSQRVWQERWSLLSDSWPWKSEGKGFTKGLTREVVFAQWFMTMEIWRERFHKGSDKRGGLCSVIHDHGNLKGKVSQRGGLSSGWSFISGSVSFCMYIFMLFVVAAD